MRDVQLFASRSRHAICRNGCSEHNNMFTVRATNGGLLFLQMLSGLASKAIVDVFSFGKDLELVFIHHTSVKEIHTDQECLCLGWYLLEWTHRPPYISPWKDECSHLLRWHF